MSFIKEFSNVHVLESQSVHWGGWSIVDVHLRAIRLALQLSDNWTHFINLSGQCFPLRTKATIRGFFAENQETTFMSFCDPDDPEVVAFINERQEATLEESDTGAVAVDNKKESLQQFSQGRISYHLGSTWFYLSRSFCRYLDSDPDVEHLKTYYRSSLVPDESFFQTCLMMSPFQQQLSMRNKRALQMDHDHEGGLHPKIYTAADLEFLMTSDALFARKFDQTVDNTILSFLEQILEV
jgi:hypothetical protein